MADSQKASTPFTNSLRSDVLLLSCFLNSQQRSLSESHPDDKDLELSHDLCCLLAIGNDLTPKAENVNANVCNVTKTGSANLSVVSTENARQDEAMVKSYKVIVKGRKQKKQGKKKGKKSKKGEDNPVPNPDLHPVPNPGLHPVPVPTTAVIELNPGKGRELLDNWNVENLNSMEKLPK